MEQLTKAIAEITGPQYLEPVEDLPKYAVDGIVPSAVVEPPDLDTLCEIVKFANAERLSLVPCGAGTKMGLGNIPERVDIIVLMRHFNRILGHETGDMTAFVEAGCPLDTLQFTLATKGQFLPLNPPYTATTIGGMIAANASGPWRALYGTARDQVIGIRVVRPDGVPVKGGGRVVKNVAGYDLNKLYTGSLGTLGIIVEVNFKVRPLPVGQRMLAAEFNNSEAAASACLRVHRSVLQPMAVEMLNSRASVSIGSADRLIPSPDGVWAFFAFEGIPAALDRQERDVRQTCEEAGAETIETIEGTRAGAVWKKFRDLPENRPGPASDAVNLKVCVLPTRVGETFDALEVLIETINGAALAHVTTGILQIYGSLFESVSADELRSLLEQSARRVREAGGHFILEAAPPELKRGLDVWGPARSDFRIMRGLKEELDPNRILNPGRFVGGL